MSRRLSEPAVACGLTRVLFTLALLSSTTLHLVAAQSPDLNASTNTTALAATAPPPPVVVTEDDQALLAQQNSLLNISYPTDGPNVPYFNKTKITVCTSDWMPAIYCANITDTSKFTGLEIELFREVTTRMGISEDQIGMFIHTRANRTSHLHSFDHFMHSHTHWRTPTHPPLSPFPQTGNVSLGAISWLDCTTTPATSPPPA